MRKWKQRDSVEDQSNRPHAIHATLTAVEERIVVELRTVLLLSLDDLLTIVRVCIQPTLSRSALDRCLRRHGISNLHHLIPIEEKETGVRKSLKTKAPGFVQVVCKQLPRMPDESSGKYLFVAMDRATRWACVEIRTARTGQDFLKKLVQKAPFVITTILTSKSTAFTDGLCAKGLEEPTGTHPVDQLCARYNIEHRLIKSTPPHSNDLEKAHDDSDAAISDRMRFQCGAQLKETLLRYTRMYNHHIPQKALGCITPIQALKKWQKTHPVLFNKSVYSQVRPENVLHAALSGDLCLDAAVPQYQGRGGIKAGQENTASVWRRLATEQEELRRLREENRRLRMEQKIVQKTTRCPGDESK